VRLIWGAGGLTLPLPSQMLTAVQVLPGVFYPLYRVVIIGATLAVALLLYVLVMRTRVGMLIRAGRGRTARWSARSASTSAPVHAVFRSRRRARRLAGLMQAPILTVPDRHGREHPDSSPLSSSSSAVSLDPRRPLSPPSSSA